MEISDCQYYFNLDKADWVYYMSDSSKAYNAGKKQIEELQKLATNPSRKYWFVSMQAHYTDFKNSKKPQPPLGYEDFLKSKEVKNDFDF